MAPRNSRTRLVSMTDPDLSRIVKVSCVTSTRLVGPAAIAEKAPRRQQGRGSCSMPTKDATRGREPSAAGGRGVGVGAGVGVGVGTGGRVAVGVGSDSGGPVAGVGPRAVFGAGVVWAATVASTEAWTVAWMSGVGSGVGVGVSESVGVDVDVGSAWAQASSNANPMSTIVSQRNGIGAL